MQKSSENVQQKLAPDLFFILINNSKQPLHAINYFIKLRHFERGNL